MSQFNLKEGDKIKVEFFHHFFTLAITQEVKQKMKDFRFPPCDDNKFLIVGNRGTAISVLNLIAILFGCQIVLERKKTNSLLFKLIKLP